MTPQCRPKQSDDDGDSMAVAVAGCVVAGCVAACFQLEMTFLRLLRDGLEALPTKTGIGSYGKVVPFGLDLIFL